MAGSRIQLPAADVRELAAGAAIPVGTLFVAMSAPMIATLGAAATAIKAVRIAAR